MSLIRNDWKAEAMLWLAARKNSLRRDLSDEALAGSCDQNPAEGPLWFLHTIEANVAPVLDIHLVMDNYGTHKTPSIKT